MKFGLPLLLLYLTAANSACSNRAGFTGTSATFSNSTSNSSPNCQPGSSVTTAKKTKVLFLVDTSGSNSFATDSTGTLICQAAPCLPATDPSKSFRAGVISHFFNEYKTHTNISWGFAVFSGTAAQSLILNANQQPAFTSDSTQMQKAITTFLSLQDVGATPYGSALSLASEIVQLDPDLRLASKPNYDVVLLTDGFPSDFVSNGAFSLSAAEAAVASLTSAPVGQITLSTVYYGSSNVPGAISLLQQLAVTGSGQFANENGANPNFEIDDVVTIPATCP